MAVTEAQLRLWRKLRTDAVAVHSLVRVVEACRQSPIAVDVVRWEALDPQWRDTRETRLALQAEPHDDPHRDAACDAERGDVHGAGGIAALPAWGPPP
jgi:hypothetical protein